MCTWDKEVRYFSRGIEAGVDLCWYRRLFACPEAEAGTATSTAIAFDASPDYLVLPDERIAMMRQQLGPRARLVAILRNPSDRFYSAYNMGMNEHRTAQNRATYDEFASSLDRMITCAPECPAEPNLVRMFFNYGLYARHLARFFAHFGRESVLVECSEEFYANPLPTVRRVLTHAGLSEPSAMMASLEHKGQTGTERNAGGQWGGAGYVGRLAPLELAKLDAFFRPHNAELYALIGRSFGWGEGRRSSNQTRMTSATMSDQPIGGIRTRGSSGGPPATRGCRYVQRRYICTQAAPRRLEL